MNDIEAAITADRLMEQLREALEAERIPHADLKLCRRRTDGWMHAVQNLLSTLTTRPVEVEAPVDRRDEPVTLGVLDDIVKTALKRALDGRPPSSASLPLSYVLDVIREESR